MSYYSDNSSKRNYRDGPSYRGTATHYHNNNNNNINHYRNIAQINYDGYRTGPSQPTSSKAAHLHPSQAHQYYGRGYTHGDQAFHTLSNGQRYGNTAHAARQHGLYGSNTIAANPPTTAPIHNAMAQQQDVPNARSNGISISEAKTIGSCVATMMYTASRFGNRLGASNINGNIVGGAMGPIDQSHGNAFGVDPQGLHNNTLGGGQQSHDNALGIDTRGVHNNTLEDGQQSYGNALGINRQGLYGNAHPAHDNALRQVSHEHPLGMNGINIYGLHNTALAPHDTHGNALHISNAEPEIEPTAHDNALRSSQDINGINDSQLYGNALTTHIGTNNASHMSQDNIIDEKCNTKGGNGLDGTTRATELTHNIPSPPRDPRLANGLQHDTITRGNDNNNNDNNDDTNDDKSQTQSEAANSGTTAYVKTEHVCSIDDQADISAPTKLLPRGACFREALIRARARGVPRKFYDLKRFEEGVLCSAVADIVGKGVGPADISVYNRTIRCFNRLIASHERVIDESIRGFDERFAREMIIHLTDLLELAYATPLTTGKSTGASANELSNGLSSNNVSNGLSSNNISNGLPSNNISNGISSNNVPNGLLSNDVPNGLSSNKVPNGLSSNGSSNGLASQVTGAYGDRELGGGAQDYPRRVVSLTHGDRSEKDEMDNDTENAEEDDRTMNGEEHESNDMGSDEYVNGANYDDDEL